nr:putative reverse transcriptase domain-containing protein [Tanacetum cinerariifolium]
MNGWLIEDEDEPLEHEASDKEVDSDLESTASRKPMMMKTTKADPDRASRNCPYCSKNGRNNGCTYKGFMACNPKEYDGKGGAIALTRWIEKMENVIDNSGCAENQKNHKMVGANHAGYTDRFHELAKLVPHLVTLKSSRIKRAGILTDKAISCGTLTEGNEKRKGVKESSKQGGGRNDDKRAKVSKGFGASTTYRNEYVGSLLNFAPLLNEKSSFVNPGYLIEVADGKKVEVDRVIRNCKLELGTSLITIDLIPLGYGSFDVIVGMDWLSEPKAEIVCHEKVVRIPLESGEILIVQGERTPGIAKALSNMKVDEPKLSDISVVRDFIEVFPEDFSGLPPQRQVEFHTDLVSGAMSVAKSPYRLAPSKMQELSAQLQELQDKGFIQPSHSS